MWRLGWRAFKRDYQHAEFAEALQYIQNQWIKDGMKQRFLRCYTNQVLHFNETSSSRVESAHWTIKRWIKLSNGDLLSVTQTIDTMVTTRHRSAEHSIANERDSGPITLFQPLFRAVIGWVANDAMREVLNQREAYQKGHLKVVDCAHYHRDALGLPCVHNILALAEADLPFRRDQFHPQWWLRTSLVDGYQFRQLENVIQIKEPRIVRTTGRPRGAANHTRKDSNMVAA